MAIQAENITSSVLAPDEVSFVVAAVQGEWQVDELAYSILLARMTSRYGPVMGPSEVWGALHDIRGVIREIAAMV